MRILIIRHADPDYTIDSLTEQGEKEAKALAAIARDLNLGDCFVSPLGRAQKTASYSLEATNKKAVTCDWLQEFPAKLYLDQEEKLRDAFDWNSISGSHGDGSRVVWDLYPEYLADHPEYFHPTAWRDTLVAKNSDMIELYDSIVKNFDELLSAYGCIRQGSVYCIEKESRETVTFFCHFGLASLLLSHLMNCSPFLLWQGTCLAPSSVSELWTEERKKGVASFRAVRLGDISHLTKEGLAPSFAARFTDVYSDETLRH